MSNIFKILNIPVEPSLQSTTAELTPISHNYLVFQGTLPGKEQQQLETSAAFAAYFLRFLACFTRELCTYLLASLFAYLLAGEVIFPNFIFWETVMFS